VRASTMPSLEKMAAAAKAKAEAKGAEGKRTPNGPRPAAKAPAKPKLKSEAKVQESLEDVRRKAEALKASAEDTKKAQAEAEKKTEHVLSAKLGDQLISKNTKTTKKETKGIFNTWDDNGNADLSKMEFRMAMRQQGLADATAVSTKHTDALFAQLDLDRGGGVDFEEFKNGIGRIKSGAQEVAQQREQSKADIERMLARAAQCEKASEALDLEMAGLNELEQLDSEGKAADNKVGEAIIKSRIKPEAIQRMWDFDGDGKVTRKEALAGIRQLPGITKEISDEELDAMYDAVFDSNKDGVLDVNEARTAFKVLKGKKKAWETEREELLEKVRELEAAAAEEQKLVAQQEKEEEELLAEREAQAKAAAEKRAALEAEKAALEAAAEKAKADAKAAKAKQKEQLEAERAAAAKARNPATAKASKKATSTEATTDKAAAAESTSAAATTAESTEPADATLATPRSRDKPGAEATLATPRSRDKPGAAPVQSID